MSESMPAIPETADQKYDAAKLIKTDLDGIAALREDVNSYNAISGGLARRLLQKETALTEDTRSALSISMASAINQVLQDATEALIVQFNGLFNQEA